MSDYHRNLSLILSRVMDDIGVSEEMVMRLRRKNLIRENSDTLRHTLLEHDFTIHIFGSQTEGTTTPGLNSDTDTLMVHEQYNVIHDWKDWVPDKCNLLMIQDDVLRPGYCKLQRPKISLPLDNDVPYGSYMYDEKKRILLKSTVFHLDDRFVSHGPAENVVWPGLEEMEQDDQVNAIPSPTLSVQYKDWSSRQRPSNWPTLDMIEYMGNTRCFVVPYVHPDEALPNIDWRISTSLAERFLMFSLNITQIRCYVLLKMIVKTFIEPHMPDVISSYICKTLLFHCLERTRRDFWIEPNLVQCVNHVLLDMLEAVYTKECPNYFNGASNLLFGKIDDEIQDQLLTKIREVIGSDGRFLLKIEFDYLNSRLILYIKNRKLMLSFDHNEKRKTQSAIYQTSQTVQVVRDFLVYILQYITTLPIDNSLPAVINFARNSEVQRRTAALWFPFFWSHLATVDACKCILQGQHISTKTLQLYRWSLGSDAASSRLKYASFLYCTGHFYCALSVLQDLERNFTRKVVQLCPSTHTFGYITNEFAVEKRRNPYPSTSNLAICVFFSRAEIQCCPREMQFEFHRSTEEDKLYRNGNLLSDQWKDLAVLDSLPYLYYLQYMTARHLGQQDLQNRAIRNLESRVCSEEKLGHRETAYNILGQCLELENNIDRALMYYRMSLQVRPRNNAAKWHVARLCFDVFLKRGRNNDV